VGAGGVEHRGLGGLQHALQAPQQGEGQDDAAVLGLLEIAAQQIRHGPDEGRQLRVTLRVHDAPL